MAVFYWQLHLLGLLSTFVSEKRRECAEKVRRYEILQNVPREEMCDLVEIWYYDKLLNKTNEEF